MSRAQRFNATGFSRWVNGSGGRAFRLAAGTAWLVVGLVFHDHWWGVAAMAWSVLPLTAGIFDVCWVSAALGGPLRGKTIRDAQVARAA